MLIISHEFIDLIKQRTKNSKWAKWKLNNNHNILLTNQQFEKTQKINKVNKEMK